MGRHAAERTPTEGRPGRVAGRIVATTIATAGLVAAGAPTVFADGAVNSTSTAVTSNQSSVTSGDLATYTITVKNTGSKPTKYTELVNAVTNGTPQSLTKTSGPDTWSCTSATKCSAAEMAVGATDTFTAVVRAGSPGTMKDTATTTVYSFDDGPISLSGSATTTVTSGSSGGSGTTITGFCPSSGCTISSSAANPTDSNDTVSRVTFPACSHATPSTQSLCNSGFTFSYTLAPANFCSVNVAGGSECTGSTVNLGDLQVSTLPQFEDINNPIVVTLIYDASITTGLSNQNGVLFNYKTQNADGNGGGELLATCGSPFASPTACNAGQSTSGDSSEGDTDLQNSTDLVSSDPWVGSYYVI